MRVLMVASEAAPFAKTGGLADVVGSLPGALRPHGVDAAILIPRYGSIDLRTLTRIYDSLSIWLAGTRYDTNVYLALGDTPFYFLDCPPLYAREGLYGAGGVDFPDNHIRFAVLSRAALEVARRIYPPDVIQCHDWQTGLVPVYLHSTFVRDPTFLGARTLFTIHNLGYQGLFPPAALADLGLDATVFTPASLEFWGRVNLMKGGLVYSDAVNTVSPTYAREIQTPEYGFGLDGVLRARSDVLSGILNGVDYSEWNPETGPYIPAGYSSDDLSGKTACKQALLREFGLPDSALDAPLIGIVSRFTVQKGADLIASAAADLAAEGIFLCVLGTGDPEYEALFLSLAARHPGRVALRLGFDNALAHLIEAGADIFLMPSKYEPCGLNQMYSLRYGTIPVVRATGGLNDTIEAGTGFKFAEYSGTAMLGAIRAAVAAFRDREGWQAMMRRAMAQDFSWNVSAAAYAALYRRMMGQAPGAR